MAKRFSGDKLSAARRAIDLTQKELARKLGHKGKRAERVIQDWEKERREPSAENLYRVAKAVGVTPDQLMTSAPRKK